MFFKLVGTIAVFALGYYLGKEIERTGPARRDLKREREGQTIDAEEYQDVTKAETGGQKGN
ncbi:MAG: hypothetical protein PVG66_07210 [Chromatiales bacterium]